ncbi:hypothetical protein [uncultured Dokdonia sp.]|uniref:hypothetical protein n=1 Tax=uncultured Dokdonia sp. TaxID=575653 RepID=UPI002612B165|nr:hypothetical protein [uncultured Dokdonia sp.]
MKTYFIIVLSLCAYVSMAQSDTISTQKTTYEYWDYDQEWQRPKFEIGGGLFIPQGKLATFIKPSPFIDLEIYFPTRRNKSIVAIFQFVLPSQEDSFIIQNPGYRPGRSG